MAKNFLGFEDNSYPDDAIVVKGEFPSIEGAVHSLSGVRLPFVDATRGVGALANNIAVLGEGIPRYMGYGDGPQPENALGTTKPQANPDRIRQLRDMYLANQRAAAGQGKSFYPSME